MEEKQDGRLERAIAKQKEFHDVNYGCDEDDPYTDYDAIDDLMGECGQDGHGRCSLAGTEYCDWECPFS